MGNINSFNSRHFQLEKLSDGVYAAINADDGWAISNAGIIDLGDRTLVFDALLAPEAAADLRDAAESLTGRKVHTVINSHPHYDHVWGNQVYSSEVDIISTTQTRDLIATEGFEEVKAFREAAPKRLETVESQLMEAGDDIARTQLRYYIIYYQAIIATLPKLQIRLPNMVFDGALTFNGPKRSAKLMTYEGAHSGSDAILHLPDDGIVFMGDILFIDGHPYLPDGDPDKIQSILGVVRNLKAKTFVPGHGSVGKIEHLDMMDEYIDTLNALVREAIKQRATEEEIGKIAIPKEYQHWIFPSFFSANLQFLFKRQTTSGAELVK